MIVLRTALALGAASIALGMAAPASAQFYLQSHDFSGDPVLGDEAGLGQVLPDSTVAERRANMAWTMRAALNVAALQCQFEPTLLTVANYNAILDDHKDELKAAFDTMSKYFIRTAKTKQLGQTALDQYGTRLYSSFATVAAQYGFCQTASSIGREAIFANRGGFSTIALNRMRELRNSLKPYGEQRFPRYIGRETVTTLPRLDEICWDKKGEWVTKKCGLLVWPPVGTGVAAR